MKLTQEQVDFMMELIDTPVMSRSWLRERLEECIEHQQPKLKFENFYLDQDSVDFNLRYRDGLHRWYVVAIQKETGKITIQDDIPKRVGFVFPSCDE